MVLRLVRLGLLVVIIFLVLGLVVALASPQTGPLEKAVLVAAAVSLVAVAAPVRAIGRAA